MHHPCIIEGVAFITMRVLVIGVMIVGWIYLVKAAWRGMKAHESIAVSLQKIAEKNG